MTGACGSESSAASAITDESALIAAWSIGISSSSFLASFFGEAFLDLVAFFPAAADLVLAGAFFSTLGGSYFLSSAYTAYYGSSIKSFPMSSARDLIKSSVNYVVSLIALLCSWPSNATSTRAPVIYFINE